MSQSVNPFNPHGLHPADCTCCKQPVVSRDAFEAALAEPVAPLDEIRKPAAAPKSARFAMVHPADCGCGCQDDDWSPIEDDRPATTTKTDAEGGRSAAPAGQPIAASGSDVHKGGAFLHPTSGKPSNTKTYKKPKKPKTGAETADEEFSEYQVRSLARALHRRAEARSAAACGYGGMDTGAWIETGIHTKGPRAGQKKATLNGTFLCDSVWLCPLCGPRIGRERAAVLAPQLEKYVAAGWSAHLGTMTAHHNRDTPLCIAIEMFRKAWAYLKNGKAWNEKVKKCGGLEYVRGYDLTWTERGGWHLHFHIVVLIGPKDKGMIGPLREWEMEKARKDGEETAKWILDRWIAAIKALGGTVSRRGLDMQPAGNAAAVAAYATTIAGVGKHADVEETEVEDGEEAKPSKEEFVKKKGFATVAEATGAASKRGRRKGSRTAADLRDDAIAGDKRSEALYIEYAKATLGLQAVMVSRGLTLDPEKEEKSEEEEEVVESKRIAVIKLRALPILDPFLAEALRAAKVSDVAAHTVLTRVLGAPGTSDESNWRIPDMSPEGIAEWKKEIAAYNAIRAADKAVQDEFRVAVKDREKAFKKRAKVREVKGWDQQALEIATMAGETKDREAWLADAFEKAKANGFLDVAIPHNLRRAFREEFETINEVSDGVFRVYPSRARAVVGWKLTRTAGRSQEVENAAEEGEAMDRESVLVEMFKKAKADGFLDVAIPHNLDKEFREQFEFINEASGGVFRINPNRVRAVVGWKLARTGGVA